MEKIKCKVCKTWFIPDKEQRYTVKENDGLSSLTKGVRTFDAFDCPVCGCQCLAGIRLDRKE